MLFSVCVRKWTIKHKMAFQFIYACCPFTSLKLIISPWMDLKRNVFSFLTTNHWDVMSKIMIFTIHTVAKFPHWILKYWATFFYIRSLNRGESLVIFVRGNHICRPHTFCLPSFCFFLFIFQLKANIFIEQHFFWKNDNCCNSIMTTDMV